MKRFLNAGFVLVVLAAASALSRQNDPAQGSAIAQGGSGWETVEQGMELRFLEARKEGVQNNSLAALQGSSLLNGKLSSWPRRICSATRAARGRRGARAADQDRHQRDLEA
jgi:hypothetical protein